MQPLKDVWQNQSKNKNKFEGGGRREGGGGRGEEGGGRREGGGGRGKEEGGRREISKEGKCRVEKKIKRLKKEKKN